MPFITQTPISDQIQNGRLPRAYSRFDLFGRRWDSLRNHDLNERPFSTPNPDSSYDVFRLAEGSQTPISNQLDLQNNTTNDVDFSGVASATWTQPSSIQSEFANIVVNNKIPLIEDQENTIDLTGYFSDEYKSSKLYIQGSAIFDAKTAVISGLVGRLGSSLGISPASIPGLFKNAYGEFETLDYDQLQHAQFAGQLQDFRQFKKSKNVRLDGASSATTGAPGAVKMVAANAGAITGETGGTYQIFDRESYFGMGNLGDPTALRKDYTVRTEASTTWRLGKWQPPINLSTLVTFRGDKVTARDFAQGSPKEVYKWKRGLFDSLLENTQIGNVIDTVTDFIGTPLNTTKDFVKFHFLGPVTGKRDTYDIFAFRSAITQLTDSFSPGWEGVDMIGRADKNYIYKSFERKVDLSFSVYATSRDELKSMWRKLNYLATYTMPEYDKNYIMYRGKYLRVTIGDLFNKQPAFITNLFYTMQDNDTTWEINLEEDPTHKQVPMRVDINMGLQMLTDHLPQYKGQAYSLYDDAEGNVSGDSNWLSDAVTTKDNAIDLGIIDDLIDGLGNINAASIGGSVIDGIGGDVI
jgi:hypothetical protein